MGAWLRAIGLERYEEGLVHNGWDDLEFLRWGRGWRWTGGGGGGGAGLGGGATGSLDHLALLPASFTRTATSPKKIWRKLGCRTRLTSASFWTPCSSASDRGGTAKLRTERLNLPLKAQPELRS